MKNDLNLEGKKSSELKTMLSQLRRGQFKLRLVKASGEEKFKTHTIRSNRRNIARIETRLTQLSGDTQ